jgi:DNA-binding transcriptional ArsR family regulator
MNVTQIVEQFQTTRQAVSIHIKLLKECGLLEIRQKGREKICVGKLQALDEVSNWVEVSRREWTARFRKLDNYLTEIKKNQHARKK